MKNRLRNKFIPMFILVSLIILITGFHVNAEPMLNIKQTINIEKNGGNLYIMYKIDIVGGKPNNLEIYLPNTFVSKGKYIYLEAYQTKGSPIPVSLDRNNLSTTISIDTSGLVEEEGKYPLTVIIYIPSFIYQNLSMQYKLKLINYPGTSVPINHTELEVNLPLDTKPDNSPPNTDIVKVSPEGAPQDQYKIEGVFDSEDIELDENGLPNVYEITIRPTKTTTPPIILLEGNASLTVKIYSDGSVEYSFLYTLFNFGRDPLAPPTNIEFKDLPSSVETDALTTLNRSLEVTKLGDMVRVALPYVTKSHEYLQVKLKYMVNSGAEVGGLLGDSIKYNISFYLPVEYFIKDMVIRVYDPTSKLIYSNVEHNLTKFSTISLKGVVRNNVLMVLGQNPSVGIPIFIIALFGVTYSLYNFFGFYARGRLPPELSSYLDKVSRFVKTMNQLIELEDKYLSREIRSKEYVSRRNNLLRRLKSELREAEESRNILRRIGEGNAVIENEVKLVDEIIDKWKELRRLENEFRNRKLNPQEYSEERRKLLLDFKSLISKLSI